MKTDTFDRINIVIRRIIDSEIAERAPLAAINAELRRYELDYSSEIVLELRTWVIGTKKTYTKPFRFPAGIWQHIKQKYAPQWFLKRWPVKFDEFVTATEIYHICPHANVKWEDRAHIEFMNMGRARE